MTAAANASLATATVNGRVYPIKTVPHCHTCTSPHRREVERLVVQGLPYKAILTRLPADSGLSEDSIRRHVKAKHLPVHDETVERLREQDAVERGEIVAEGAQAEVNHITFARGILRQVERRLADGELQPDLRDGLAAARHLAMFDLEVGLDTDAISQAIRLVMDEAKNLMSEGQWLQFGKRLASNATLRQLLSA